MIKRLVLIALLTHSISYADHRPPCLAAAGLVAVIAAVILIAEKYQHDGAFIGGVALATAGLSTIIASNDLINWYDRGNGHTFTFRF
jgi:hypothetical protein